MTTTTFDKTEKGRDEIATRANHLAARLRTLLLLVDGKRDTVELMAKVAGLGLDEKSLVELLEGGFIQVASGSAGAETSPHAALPPVPQASTQASTQASAQGSLHAPGMASALSPPSAPVANVAVDTRANTPAVEPVDSATGATPVAGTAVDPAANPGALGQSDSNAVNLGILRDGETQFQALYNFFNETIRSVIGLRGFTMQLKVERAATIADFRLLRTAYLEAVLKAKGPEMEHSLRNRLDQLLGLGD